MSNLNVGNFDRVLRILLGLALFGLAIVGTIGPWGYVGLALIVTGLGAFCPVYRVFGLRTCSR